MAIVVAIDPLEAEFAEVVAPESPLRFVEDVEIVDETLEPLVRVVLQQLPLQIAPYIPLSPLAKFHPHEDGFLAGMGPHVCQQCPYVGKFLPVVTWHFVQEVALAMHYFVVA